MLSRSAALHVDRMIYGFGRDKSRPLLYFAYMLRLLSSLTYSCPRAYTEYG